MDIKQTSAKDTRGCGNVIPSENAPNTLDSEKVDRDTLEGGGCKTLTYQQNREFMIHDAPYQDAMRRSGASAIKGMPSTYWRVLRPNRAVKVKLHVVWKTKT